MGSTSSLSKPSKSTSSLSKPSKSTSSPIAPSSSVSPSQPPGTVFKVQMEIKMGFTKALTDPESKELAKTIKDTFVSLTGAPASVTSVVVTAFTSGRRRLLSYYYKATIVSTGLSEAKGNQVVSTSNSIAGPIKKNLETKFPGVTVTITQSASISEVPPTNSPTKSPTKPPTIVTSSVRSSASAKFITFLLFIYYLVC